MFWLGFILIQVIVVVAIVVGSTFMTFVNTPSLIVTLIGGQPFRCWCSAYFMGT